MSDQTNSTKEVMLTTKDNPYNPFTHYDEWYEFDTSSGYNTCSYLARIASSSEDLSEDEESSAIRKAMIEIVEFNVTGNYILVTEDSFKSN